ncbi:hypothetical protein L226DRAFT_522479 [Lentinus tigrinus ALCF2SS1-7]|uniref:Uncharacterized protein n=1 Tax=Lentinus tigrinus ALCF2SS1-6 TaxID=1328759 RepID=A0A5C2SJR6_9APHY|nr:hypothetical protein L227DRAFT_621951 [Lentinus tigrinus ALCF2SS1-6]RPD76073.1 hypothetical protein L226DRAFT_522479 [Lentinus tigrinus ALCF2SS1-7]
MAHHVLYLPHLLFQGTPQNPAVPTPNVPSPTARRLPFELPRMNMTTAIPQGTRCRPLHRSLGFCTGDYATTDPNVAGQALEPHNTLQRLTRCPDLNSRLRAYANPNPADPEGVNPTTPWQQQMYSRVYPNQPWAPGMKGLTTGGIGETHPFPSAEEQYQAIVRLSGWYIEHLSDPVDEPENVESEPAIQDQVKQQLHDPLSLIMRSRYPNFYGAGNQQQQQQQQQQQLLGAAGYQGGGPTYFPRFGRPTNSTHTVGVITGHASGIPDSLLFPNQINGAQELCGEVKTFWVYRPDNAYGAAVFRDGVALSGTGEFNWHGNAIAIKLVKQVWCELVNYGLTWAYSTNGKTVMIFAKLSRNMLVAGDPIPWDSPELLQTLAGLCFASVDQAEREWLPEYLCEGHAVTW